MFDFYICVFVFPSFLWENKGSHKILNVFDFFDLFSVHNPQNWEKDIQERKK